MKSSIWRVILLIHSHHVGRQPSPSYYHRMSYAQYDGVAKLDELFQVCQHQNVQRKAKVQLDDSDYALSVIGSQEDFADFTVLPAPKGGDESKSASCSAKYPLYSAHTQTLP